MNAVAAHRPHPNALVWLVLSAAIIALDQWTKHIALAHLVEGMPQPVIPGFLNWTLAFNTGAAFSFLADAGGWQRWGFGVLAITVSAVLAVWLSRTPRGDWPTAAPLALVIGGALGNLVDRVRYGHVVDFIQTYYWPGQEFPAFNIADSAISVGAVMMILVSLFGGKDGQGAR
ncbi:signal peptidase II [Tahibacter soli]|uniref:Lipoprotein signal peptidase n=1 Tax=Tahibacter soli TaxID=2983605 RepID=A0A9X3YID9_9GAMM|nr:signal peptidase II [Tahibacter soli]MDC8011626.1 signal peptidase II [Tahibacter soli]